MAVNGVNQQLALLWWHLKISITKLNLLSLTRFIEFFTNGRFFFQPLQKLQNTVFAYCLVNHRKTLLNYLTYLTSDRHCHRFPFHTCFANVQDKRCYSISQEKLNFTQILLNSLSQNIRKPMYERKTMQSRAGVCKPLRHIHLEPSDTHWQLDLHSSTRARVFEFPEQIALCSFRVELTYNILQNNLLAQKLNLGFRFFKD